MKSFFEEPPLHDFPDRAIRLLLEFPAHLQEVVEAVEPAVAALLDFTHAEVLRRDLPMPDWRRRETDLLFHVPFRSDAAGTGSLICVLVEHSSVPDQRTPLRSLLYAVLYWERQWQLWEKSHPRGESLRLSPVLPIVFCTSQQVWDAPRSFRDLFGDPGLLRPFLPDWQPLLWEVATRSTEELLSGKGDWLPALAVVRAEKEDPERFAQVFEAALRRLAPLNETERLRWYNLVWFLMSWAMRRRPAGEKDALIQATTAAVESARVQEEIRAMASKVEICWEDEVFARGEQHGKASMRLATLRTALRLALEVRFAPLPEAFLQRLESINDPDRLEQLIRQAVVIKTLTDLEL